MLDGAVPNHLHVAEQALRALVLYSLAEYQAGHARVIRVELTGAAFSIADDGRGHAIDRAVGDAPYLQFIYTHLEYPFGSAGNAPVQLHGIGMSLLNALCCELSVTVRRADATLRLMFKNGRLCDKQLLHEPSEQTGNLISGVIHPALQASDRPTAEFEQWLRGILMVNSSLEIDFNGEKL